MSNTDKLREIAVKFFPTEEKLSNNSLYNQLQQSSQDKLLSDLTTLISEGYVSKEEYNRVVGLLQSQNPFPNRPNPRDVNPYDSKAIKRSRRR